MDIRSNPPSAHELTFMAELSEEEVFAACRADNGLHKLTGADGGCGTPSHQDQWTGPALTKAAAHRFEQRRRCHGCREWWQSSAGGISGVFSIVLVVIIVLYAAFIIASPALIDNVIIGSPGEPKFVAKTFLQITMPVKVVVGSICALLIVFAVWTIRRVTCARASTLVEIARTDEERLHSKWLVVRAVTLLLSAKGPASPWFAHVTLAKELFETFLQILNVAGYAEQGYSPGGTCTGASTMVISGTVMSHRY